MKELQRRLDQTLGKPGSYHHGMDREGHIKPMTIGARLYRLENQVIVDGITTTGISLVSGLSGRFNSINSHIRINHDEQFNKFNQKLCRICY